MPVDRASGYPHLRQPQNPLLRVVWWLGQTAPYFHATCGQEHIPGPCNDGVDRNGPTQQKLLRVIDYPPLVALWRIGAVAIVAAVLWTWFS